MVPAAAAGGLVAVVLGLALFAPASTAAARTLEAQELAKIGFAPRSSGVLRPALVPNDPMFRLASFRWVLRLPGFTDAWTTTTGDPGTIIAIVDTGVDPAVADLQGALLPGYDFYDDDTDASDLHGHGTMMASLAAARTDNGVGIAGACGSCSILPVRVGAADGTSSWSTTAAGIVWAADRGAHVISVSLVGTTVSPELTAAVAYAQSRNALVVAAAGNLGEDRAEYPAALPGVLSVQATDRRDELYPFSNHGAGVSISAPGCAMAIAPGGDYRSACGTSVATALVAGAAGLLASTSPSATAQQLADALTQGAVRASDSRFGRLDVPAALALLAGRPLPRALAPPTVVGDATPGSTLTATVGAWTNAATFVFQWLRCRAAACAPIPGATHATYTVVPADEGRRIIVRVTAMRDDAQAAARSPATIVHGTPRSRR